jgi:hypothetical protein
MLLNKLVSIKLLQSNLSLLEKNQTAAGICSFKYFANATNFNGAHYHDHNHSRQHGKGLQGVCPYDCPKSTLMGKFYFFFTAYVSKMLILMTYNAGVENAYRRCCSGDQVNVYTGD